MTNKTKQTTFSLKSWDPIFKVEQLNKGWDSIINLAKDYEAKIVLEHKGISYDLKHIAYCDCPQIELHDNLLLYTSDDNAAEALSAVFSVLNTFDFIWKEISGERKDSAEIDVKNADGMHMRPCLSVVDCAYRFESLVALYACDNVANAKSINSVSFLQATYSTRIDIRAIGPDS